MDAVSRFRVLGAALIGFSAWHGLFWAIPLSIFIPCLAASQRTRFGASAASFAYYASTSYPVVAVAREYSPSIGARALGLWLIAAVLLSAPLVMCWTGRSALRPWTTIGAMILSVLPPLCIVGWASPLVSAGVLFPNSGWLGVIATSAFPGLLLVRRTRVIAVLAAAIAAGFLNAHAKRICPPKAWEAVTTHIHRARKANDMAEFAIEEHLQEVAVSSKRTVLVFPEDSVRRWTDATDAFWTDATAGSGKTLLIGAGQPIAGSRLYNNSIVIVGEHQQPPVHQRIPVPGGMWNPFRRDSGFALNLLKSGTVDLGGERAAILICYEQLLVWPILRSAMERPTLLIAASNEAWTATTRVPKVQHACVRAWARLFGLPVLSAINS
jgi:apolipoprotein N-acyltransferase